MTKAGFFHHFKSKEALGVAAAHSWSELIDGPVEGFTCLAVTMVQEVFGSSDGKRHRRPFATLLQIPVRRHRLQSPNNTTMRPAMSYFDGFVIPVPSGNKEAYRRVAAAMAPIFMELGALRVVEAWNDDVQPGKVNDFRTAVIAEPDEEVVFSFVEWPSKAVRDAAHVKMMDDPRMDSMEMPFSGQRLIYGGFTSLVDTHTDAKGA